jgi:hypothetical protein
MVISPWAKPGYVYKDKVCHASVLAFVEWRFGLRPMTRRDASALAENRFFLDAFDFAGKPHETVELPLPAFDPLSLSVDCFGGDFAPELPETKLPGSQSSSSKAQRLAHEDLFKAADLGLLGFDRRATAQASVLDAVRRARAGNGGVRVSAATTCDATVLGTSASQPPSGGSPPASPSGAGAPPAQLAATGDNGALRLGVGAAAIGAAAGAAALRRRTRESVEES